MQCQMIWSRKSSFTKATLKRPIACVFSVMPCEFIGSSKPPFTTFPRAFIWFFARMCSHMSLEMRAFGVDLFTTRMITVMYSSSLQIGRISSMATAINQYGLWWCVWWWRTKWMTQNNWCLFWRSRVWAWRCRRKNDSVVTWWWNDFDFASNVRNIKHTALWYSVLDYWWCTNWIWLIKCS